jgi:hypothetical protein
MSAFGAKREVQTALVNVRFEGKNGHEADVTRFLLLTHSRHCCKTKTMLTPQKPGELQDILGGGDAQPQEQAPKPNLIADILSSRMAKAVLAGIAAMVVKRVMGPSQTA